ncbi:hypothetical protein [Brackiella oedipodis]|uniref:hypothetical protein n=1 Tax=Brackiella oedipodis TaxID=124225 RepID=UPI00048C4FA0|nr:hypothetical protein [Brackiella oedipodis]
MNTTRHQLTQRLKNICFEAYIEDIDELLKKVQEDAFRKTLAYAEIIVTINQLMSRTDEKLGELCSANMIETSIELINLLLDKEFSQTADGIQLKECLNLLMIPGDGQRLRFKPFSETHPEQHAKLKAERRAQRRQMAQQSASKA